MIKLKITQNFLTSQGSAGFLIRNEKPAELSVSIDWDKNISNDAVGFWQLLKLCIFGNIVKHMKEGEK